MVATSLNNVAMLYKDKNDYARAEPLYQRALRILEKARGPDHPDVADSLTSLAGLYMEKRDYARAEPLYQRALHIREKALGPDHPDVAISLTSLARMYYWAQSSGGKRDSARVDPYYPRVLHICEKALGPDHLSVVDSLTDLAGRYEFGWDSARREPLLQCALRIREKALGPDHPDVATSLEDLAMLYHDKGDYAQAEPLYQRALRILEKAEGPNDLRVAISLYRLARLYHDKGDYARAEALYPRLLRIRDNHPQDHYPYLAADLDNMAELYEIRGSYARAEPLHQRALRIREKKLGPDHSDVATSLNNLAMLYRNRGDHARAEPLFQRALSIREQALEPDHSDVATSLNNLAMLYREKGDYARAEPLFQRALSIREQVAGLGRLYLNSLNNSLNNLAMLYQDKGDYVRAEPYYQRALHFSERELGPDDPDVAISLNNLAALYQYKGDYARAEPLLQRALHIWEKARWLDPPHLAISLNNLVVLYAVQGRLADAVQARQRSARIEDHNVTLTLATGSGTQARAYMAALTGPTDASISLHVKEAPSNGQAARLALTTILQRKGRVLDAMTDSLAALRRHLAPSDQDLFDRLSSVNSQLRVQLWRGPGELSVEQHKKNLKDLEDERQKLEEQLGPRSAAFRAEQRPLTLKQVQQALPAGSALLEIFRYRPYNSKVARWGRPRYVAYVLHRQGELPFVDLGDAAPIEAAVQKLRAALADPDRTHDPKPAARALDALVMQPIRKLLGDTRWVLLSPDGDLNLVPFEALVDEQGRYLIERFAFTYLTSGRDLVRLEQHAPPKQGTLIVANPDFSVRGASTPAPEPDAGHRGLRSVDLARASFPPLSSTAEEARAIAHVLFGAQELLAAQATEGAVKAVKSPRILHLATHGFFLPDQPEPKLPDERRSGLGLEPTSQEIAALLQRENPLLRAGLALAGAITRVSGDKDDGILTALEVSGMDLVGTKLVVLSACETGVGEAVSGEGVYGLRRALVMAGAETQVMSLWKVDTVWTRELMIAYYKKLKAGAGRGEAMRQAQLEMLGRKETSHPNLWASFIVSGDWRTLDDAPAVPDFRVHPGPRGCACTQTGAGGAEGWLRVVLAGFSLSVVAGRRRLRMQRRARRSEAIV